MAAINFPSSPTMNQEFVAAGKTWQWDGVVWNIVSTIPTPTQEPWVRPVEWLPMPTMVPTDEMFAGLIAVFDHDSNFCELSAEGAYTVDWGDGVVENYATGVSATHTYNYTDTDLTDTSSSLGYKQAMVIVTPQTGELWTKFSLQEGVIPGSIYTAPVNWLDIAISGPALTTLNIGLED